jgi:hypothetical protein
MPLLDKNLSELVMSCAEDDIGGRCGVRRVEGIGEGLSNNEALNKLVLGLDLS